MLKRFLRGALACLEYPQACPTSLAQSCGLRRYRGACADIEDTLLLSHVLTCRAYRLYSIFTYFSGKWNIHSRPNAGNNGIGDIACNLEECKEIRGEESSRVCALALEGLGLEYPPDLHFSFQYSRPRDLQKYLPICHSA